MQKTIIKERTLYQLDGLVLSIDNVRKQINGEEVDLGNFVEMRTTDRESGQEQILLVMERLGFDINDAIRESYVEM
jgi:adenylate cyclase class IV